MDAQQLLNCIIKPTHKFMGGRYESVESNFLSLCTTGIESECGKFNKQINGPALSWWQIEPATHDDIWANCDALKDKSFARRVLLLAGGHESYSHDLLLNSPMYACAMARLKYSMDAKALPKYNGGTSLDLDMFYRYYKRVYNTELGASTYQKWIDAINRNGILKVQL